MKYRCLRFRFLFSLVFVLLTPPGLASERNEIDQGKIYLSQPTLPDSGTTIRVSVASDGTQGDEQSIYPSISADGHYVAFESEASNLVTNDTYGREDIFDYDRYSGEITRASIASNVAMRKYSAARISSSLLSKPDPKRNKKPSFHPLYIDLSIPKTHSLTCGSWSVVSSPNVGTGSNILDGIVAISANDIWAVGGTPGQTLVEHWDGNNWSVVPSPNHPVGGGRLRGVGANSAKDIWAVGDYAIQRTLIEHWDGMSWSVVTSIDPTWYMNSLTDVAVVSSNDVWAVGWWIPPSPYGPYTLAEHWDGTSWSIVPSPELNGNGNLSGVSAVSSNDIWSVGNYFNGSKHLPLIEHWDGQTWNIVPTPDLGSTTDARLEAVKAFSVNNVWAVGRNGTHTLVMHWNGIEWSVVQSPSDEPDNSGLLGITFGSSADIWAVGYSKSLIEHWNGSSWNLVSGPNPDSGAHALHGVAFVSSLDLWAVGYYQPSGGTNQTLIARYTDPCALFLDLPISYSNPAAKLLGVNGGGSVTSWFDHDVPSPYGQNDEYLLRWDGYPAKPDPPLPAICKYGENCYDNHEGIDFNKTQEVEYIYAAAPGSVSNIVNACQNSQSTCGGGYGNQVWIDHGNGYATLYGHLASVLVQKGDEIQQYELRTRPIGIMGKTGNVQGSDGTHLHFGVYFDPNNSWDRSMVLDPFGWQDDTSGSVGTELAIMSGKKSTQK